MALNSSSTTDSHSAYLDVVGCAVVAEYHWFSALLLQTWWRQMTCHLLSQIVRCTLGCEGCDTDNTTGDGESILQI